MKTIYSFVICFFLWEAPAAPFINLDFEMANLSHVTSGPGQSCAFAGFYGTGPAAELLPGWTIISGTNSLAIASYGDGYAETNLAGSYRAGIYFKNSVLVDCYPFAVLKQGNFGLVIDNPVPQPGVPRNTNLTSVGLTVIQRGDIPPEADTMTFLFRSPRITSVITIDGNPLQFCSFDECDLFKQVDISQWAGKTVTLLFSANGLMVIDDIQFIQTRPHPPIVSGKADINQLSLSWPAQGDFHFQIEVATNLPPGWKPLAGRIITTGGISQFVERFSTNNPATVERYYRLRSSP